MLVAVARNVLLKILRLTVMSMEFQSRNVNSFNRLLNGTDHSKFLQQPMIETSYFLGSSGHKEFLSGDFSRPETVLLISLL